MDTLQRARRASQDVAGLPLEFLDATCYFITSSAFDTLLQCTSSHSPLLAAMQAEPAASQPRRRLSISTSTTHFFTGSLVCTNPPLVLATGTSVDVLERDWAKYFVLVDLNNVAPSGHLPSLFSTVSCLHAISKGYRLGVFGEVNWMLLEVAPLRKHIPSGAGSNGSCAMNSSNNAQATSLPIAIPPTSSSLFADVINGRRGRSNSLPLVQTPDEYASDNGSSDSSHVASSPEEVEGPETWTSSSSTSSSTGARGYFSQQRTRSPSMASRHRDEWKTHPELNPSHSVCFDWTQAASYSPGSQEPSRMDKKRRRSSIMARPTSIHSIHALLRARLSCLYTPYRSRSRISLRVYFGRSTTHGEQWRLDDGLLVAVDDGRPCGDDCWKLGGNGREYLTSDDEYECTLTSGLVAEGVLEDRPAATMRRVRLIRRSGSWETDVERVVPQVFVEVEDPEEDVSCTLGPVLFEPEGIRGREWVGEIPTLVC